MHSMLQHTWNIKCIHNNGYVLSVLGGGAYIYLETEVNWSWIQQTEVLEGHAHLQEVTGTERFRFWGALGEDAFD